MSGTKKTPTVTVEVSEKTAADIHNKQMPIQAENKKLEEVP